MRSAAQWVLRSFDSFRSFYVMSSTHALHKFTGSGIDADDFPDFQIQGHLDRGAGFDDDRFAAAGSRIAADARFAAG